MNLRDASELVYIFYFLAFVAPDFFQPCARSVTTTFTGLGSNVPAIAPVCLRYLRPYSSTFACYV